MASSKNDLRLAKVALLETRMGAELARLIRTYGGIPVCVPSVSENPADASEEVNSLIDRMVEGDTDVTLLQTGVSIQELARVASSLNRTPDLIEGLGKTFTVCRGPKPVAALRRLGLTADALVPEPHTTADMITTLSEMSMSEASLTIVHHGERNERLVFEASALCHAVDELVLYRWELPSDTAPLRELVRDLIAGSYDAIAFTSQVQVRHLFSIAGESGLEAELTNALNHKAVVTVVGPTCAAELRDRGITPDISPTRPKMGHMALALANQFSARSGKRAGALV